MSLRIYCVYDFVAKDVVGAVMPVFPADGAASRFFIDAVRSGKTAMSSHPEDYGLLCLAELDIDPTGGPLLIPRDLAVRSPVILGKDVVGEGAVKDQLSLLES